MKRYLSNVLSSAIYYGKKIRPLSKSGLRILTYHRVNDISGDRLSVRPQEFEKQMEWLTAHGYIGVSVRQSLRGAPVGATKQSRMEIASGASRPRNDIPIAITFDDGYLDNYINAFPILKKYGFSATVYIITGRVQNGADRTFLSWDEIKEMNKYGIEFGSHTVTHPRLTSVDTGKAKQEIEISKQEVEKKLGQACESFCYPGGMRNQELVRFVRASGYSNATTVMPGINSPETDSFLLKRTEISGEDSLFEFEKKINGAYDFLHKIWQAAGMLK